MTPAATAIPAPASPAAPPYPPAAPAGTPSAPPEGSGAPGAPGVPDVTGLELADAVEAVRSALMLGAARGAGRSVRFQVGEIRMDFTVELQRTSTGHAGVKAWVVEAGGDRARSSTSTHTVSLSLRPVDAATDDFLVISAPPGNADSVTYD